MKASKEDPKTPRNFSDKTMELYHAEVVLEFAENDMNGARTSNALKLQGKRIYYILDSIRDATSLDPRKFEDLRTLVEIAKTTLYKSR